MVTRLWGEDLIISRGMAYTVSDLPGFVAEVDGVAAGLLTFCIDGTACEIVTLDSWRERMGVGSALIAAMVSAARERGCSRLWLITTNDNLHALGFYQRRGFRLAALYPDAIAEARRRKPSIPLIGLQGIPIRDEIELEMALTT
jgi:ribosomal protein S18 acetylase RimI-like enzyme